MARVRTNANYEGSLGNALEFISRGKANYKQLSGSRVVCVGLCTAVQRVGKSRVRMDVVFYEKHRRSSLPINSSPICGKKIIASHSHRSSPSGFMFTRPRQSPQSSLYSYSIRSNPINLLAKGRMSCPYPPHTQPSIPKPLRA